MSKDVLFGRELNEKILKGVNILADAVGATLGPRGRNVIIENKNTLTVMNDNNFPGSSGRNAKRADDNEIIQIKLPKALY